MALRLIVTASLLLTTMSWAVSAQTMQTERLKQVVSDLRGCVRTYAPAAEAVGITTAGDAVNFFRERCGLPLALTLGQKTDHGQNADIDTNGTGALPPGTFRIAVIEEWTTWVEEGRPR